MQHAFTITFDGHIPPKKNNKRRVYRHGKPLMITSKAHTEWEEKELASLQSNDFWDVDIPLEPVDPPYYLIYKFWIGSLMSFDLSNSIESVQDLLVKAGILVDDSWRYVRGSSFELMGMDFDNPRCEVSIYQLEVSEFDLALALLLDKPKFKAEAKRRRVSQKALDVELRRQLTA